MSDPGELHRTQDTFGKGPIALLLDRSISDGAVRQYLYMHWRYGANGQNFEGREKIADAMGVSERTVTNRSRELERANWLVVNRRYHKKTRTTRNFYHVFEDRAECETWRAEHHDETPEPATPRKLRKGKGGKPEHKEKDSERNLGSLSNRNSGSGHNVNSGSGRDLNSGSAYLDSEYLDSDTTTTTESDHTSDPEHPAPVVVVVPNDKKPQPISEQLSGQTSTDWVKDAPEEVRELITSGGKPDPDLALVSRAYQDNIDPIVSSMVNGFLKEALKTYPAAWIVAAIEVAVKANNKRWRYVEGILDRWRVEGTGPQNGKGPSKQAPPVHFPKPRPDCATCGGTGMLRDGDGKSTPCPDCLAAEQASEVKRHERA